MDSEWEKIREKYNETNDPLSRALSSEPSRSFNEIYRTATDFPKNTQRHQKKQGRSRKISTKFSKKRSLVISSEWEKIREKYNEANDPLSHALSSEPSRSFNEIYRSAVGFPKNTKKHPKTPKKEDRSRKISAKFSKIGGSVMDSEWEKIRKKYNETNDPLKALGEHESLSEEDKMERRKAQIDELKETLNPVGETIGEGFRFLLFFSIITPIPLLIAIAFIPLMIVSLFMGEFRAFFLLLLIAVAFFAFVHEAMKD